MSLKSKEGVGSTFAFTFETYVGTSIVDEYRSGINQEFQLDSEELYYVWKPQVNKE